MQDKGGVYPALLVIKKNGKKLKLDFVFTVVPETQKSL